MQNLIPNYTYHIYNRAIGEGIAFRQDENFQFFIRQYVKFVNPIANTLSYCLMPNHYHFLIQIKEDLAINKAMNSNETKIRMQKPDVSKYLSNQIGRFINSYTQAYNKKYKRKGGLFIKPFKRKLVENEKYLYELIKYIHLNPVSHGFVDIIEKWKYTSYSEIIGNRKDQIVDRDLLLNYFDSVEEFISFLSLNIDHV